MMILFILFLFFGVGACTEDQYSELVDAIKNKQKQDIIIDLLSKVDKIDITDDQGRSAMVQAVQSDDFDIVELLISIGGSVNIQQSDGQTPLSAAFKNQNNQISELILKFGGNPNTTDLNGKQIRKYATNLVDKKYLDQFDEFGFEFFEDGPGDWLRGQDEKTQQYFYYNVKSKKSMWRMPPSCCWNSQLGPHNHTFYVNSLTAQVKHVLPKALSWRLIQKSDNDKPFWYNFATNFSMLEDPAELPLDMLESVRSKPNYYWFNKQTQQISWVEPATLQWRAVQHPEVDEMYYYHPETLQTSWELPKELAWEVVQSETQDQSQQKATYYHNKITGESQWEEPEHLAWILHDEL